MGVNGDEVKKKAAKSGSPKRTRGGGLTPSRLKKIIRKLMDNLEKEDNSSKTSVSELLKLMQIYKELTAEQVKEVEVRWVDRLRPEEEPGK